MPETEPKQDIVPEIKNSLERILNSGVLDKLQEAREELKGHVNFIKELASLIWKTKELMNELQIIAPYDQYNFAPEKMINHRTGKHDVGICVYACEIDNEKNPGELHPAHIWNGYDDLDESQDKVYAYPSSIPELKNCSI